MFLRSEGAKARERRAEQAQAIARDTRREWGSVEKPLHTKKNEATQSGCFFRSLEAPLSRLARLRRARREKSIKVEAVELMHE